MHQRTVPTNSLRRLLLPAAIACFMIPAAAFHSSTAALPSAGVLLQQSWEAEATEYVNASVEEDPSASGGMTLTLGQEGVLWLEVETTDAEQSLVIKFRSLDVDRILDLTIDSVPHAPLPCRTNAAGAWDTVQVPLAFTAPGAHVVQIALSADSLEGCSIDVMSTCDQPVGLACEGCEGNINPPVVFFGKVTLILPPMPGNVGMFAGFAGQFVDLDTARLDWVAPSTHDGECELKPKDVENPCGEKECKEKKGCSVDVSLSFKSVDYPRFIFWDSTEEVTLSSGQVLSFIRAAVSQQISQSGTAPCNPAAGVNVEFRFQYGIVAIPLHCTKCQ